MQLSSHGMHSPTENADPCAYHPLLAIRPRHGRVIAAATVAAAAASPEDGAEVGSGAGTTKEQRINSEAAEVQFAVYYELPYSVQKSIGERVTREQMTALAASFLREGMSTRALKAMLIEQPDILTLHPSQLEPKLSSIHNLMKGVPVA